MVYSLFAAIITFAYFYWSEKTVFLTSSVVPAARGNVKVKKDNNKNYLIQVDIANLTEVDRLQPPRNTYVVWMVTDKNLTKNIGQIDSSTGVLSNKLKASFQTASLLKPVKIYITAEDDANVQYSSNEVVLETNNF